MLRIISLIFKTYRMKTGLKIRLLFVFFTLACTVNAQIYRLEVGYNNPVRLGSNVSSIYFNGIKLGGTAEIDMKNNFSLLTGVLYNFVYSYKVQNYPSLAAVKYETQGLFMNFPVHVNYSYPISKTIRAFGFAGPTLNLGLYQNLKITSTQTYLPSNPLYVKPRTIDVYNGNDPVYQLNRLNLQLGGGGGVQWKKYQIKAGYDFGLNNLNKIDTNKLYQGGWYVSLSYSF